MKRYERFPDETSRIGHILFWLFPYEQDTLCHREPPVDRATNAPARKERLSQLVRTIDAEGRDGTNQAERELLRSTSHGHRASSSRGYRGRRSSPIS